MAFHYRPSEILMRDPLMNLWSIFPKERENLTDLIAERHSSL